MSAPMGYVVLKFREIFRYGVVFMSYFSCYLPLGYQYQLLLQ